MLSVKPKRRDRRTLSRPGFVFVRKHNEPEGPISNLNLSKVDLARTSWSLAPQSMMQGGAGGDADNALFDRALV